jgi:hypothetical protein
VFQGKKIKMAKSSSQIAICPLFGFDIKPKVLVGHYTPKEVSEYFRSSRNKIEQGFSILENVTIRLFTKDDYQKIERWCTGLFTEFLTGLHQVRFVIEFTNIQETYERKVGTIIQDILLSIRLHKAIPVICPYYWFEEESMIKGLSVFSPERQLTKTTSGAISHVHLEVEDIPVVTKLLGAIQKGDFAKKRSFKIACERFNRSFEEPNEDEILIDYCIAFEAS